MKRTRVEFIRRGKYVEPHIGTLDIVDGVLFRVATGYTGGIDIAELTEMTLACEGIALTEFEGTINGFQQYDYYPLTAGSRIRITKSGLRLINDERIEIELPFIIKQENQK